MNNDIINQNSVRSEIPSLAIIVPCYNEAEAFSRGVTELSKVIDSLITKKKIKDDSYILFIDDGSIDNTWLQIKQSAEQMPHVRGLKLSRNQGQRVAMLAGLSSINTDVSVSVDVDLQDDLNCIEQMIDKYMQGNEIVYGVRDDRSKDSIFKRNTANMFYKLMNMMGVNHIPNHSEYRLLSKRAVNCLLEYKEQNLYIRGVLPLIGFQSDKVFYARQERIDGETKYSFLKLLSLAIEAITSFSVFPLRLIAILGFGTCILALISMFYGVISKIGGFAVQGWSSLIISIFFLSGVQLLSLGVIGEYIGKIYIETKQRPKFFIDETVGKL